MIPIENNCTPEKNTKRRQEGEPGHHLAVNEVTPQDIGQQGETEQRKRKPEHARELQGHGRKPVTSSSHE